MKNIFFTIKLKLENSTMKKLTTKLVMPVLALMALFVLTTALAEPTGDPVAGTGEAVANMGVFPPLADGSATLVVRGATLVASVHVEISDSYYSDEGVLHGLSSHTFTFANGKIITSDKVIGEPTDTPGLLKLNETLTIVEGTGDFDGATGVLTVHGEMAFRIAEPWLADVSYDVRGVILIN